MKVLVACERSGVVREAFRRRGHDAWSCDLELAHDRDKFHIQGDALEAAYAQHWDLMIAHPECRYLCNSGSLRLYLRGKKANGPDLLRWTKMQQAAQFFIQIMSVPIARIAVENSVMHGYAKGIIQPYLDGWVRQIVQPHQFGEDASKATMFMLKGLLPLKSTKDVPPRWVEGRPRWANQTDSGQNRLGPSPERSMIRARTYDGIADAMAEQWGDHSISDHPPCSPPSDQA